MNGPDEQRTARRIGGPARSMLHVWLHAWAFTIVGGALCGVLCLGALSAAVFFLSAPFGAVVGVFAGGPLGLVLAVALRLLPAASAQRVVRRLSVTGAVIGVAGSAAADVVVLGGVPTERSLAWIANLVLAAIAVGFIGRWLGRELAMVHLREIGMPVPPRAPLRARAHARRPRVVALSIAVLVAIVAVAWRPAPDPPSNVVIAWVMDRQMGDTAAATGHLCNHLRHHATAGERAALDTVATSSMWGDDNFPESFPARDRAEVQIRVATTPSYPGDPGAPWTARFVLQRGAWRLCSLRRLG